METRTINEEYALIAHDLIENEAIFTDIANSHATIIYLSSDYEKKKPRQDKVVEGECEKVQDKNKWGIPADFTITLYEPNLIGKSSEAIRRILFHELLHVGIIFCEDGSEKYFIRDHDIEDFKECIDRWGTDWSNI
jgi:hypothetical protein